MVMGNLGRSENGQRIHTWLIDGCAVRGLGDRNMSMWTKKAITVEAVQLLWSTWQEMCEFANVGKLADGRPTGCYVGDDGKALPDNETSETMGLLIPTLEGTMLAKQGDWVIRGVKGELYPCKPDIFEATYEPACE